MAATYLIQFPPDMKNEKRLKILEEFQSLSWETYENMDPSQIIFTGFEGFWPHASKPHFPENSNECIITEK